MYVRVYSFAYKLYYPFIIINSSHFSNIKSGWKNIFATFSLAASDNDSAIVELSFQSTTQIVNDFLTNEKFAIVDSFQDCIKCLSEFGCNPLFPEITDEINLNPHENKKKWRGKRWNPINFFQYIHTELLFVLMLLI